MATIISTPASDIISDTEYTITEGYYNVLPKNTSGNITLSLKNTESQGFTVADTFTGSKIVYIGKFQEFKFTYSGSSPTLTLSRYTGYKG